MRYNKTCSIFRERDLMNMLEGCRYNVNLHASFQDEQYLYFLMEYCSRESLKNLIDFHGGLPPYVYTTIAAQLVFGLEKIHEFKIVHRDLKPANILLKEDF